MLDANCTRAPANTFPEGSHYRGGTYGTDVNMPLENNPNVDRPAYDQTRA